MFLATSTCLKIWSVVLRLATMYVRIKQHPFLALTVYWQSLDGYIDSNVSGLIPTLTVYPTSKVDNFSLLVISLRVQIGQAAIILPLDSHFLNSSRELVAHNRLLLLIASKLCSTKFFHDRLFLSALSTLSTTRHLIPIPTKPLFESELWILSIARWY